MRVRRQPDHAPPACSASTRPSSAARRSRSPIDGALRSSGRSEIGLDVAPGAPVYALPCIAGHVGADAAGVVLAEGPHLQRRDDAARRRRHQRRDRARQPRAAARLLLADRPGLRGRADLLRPARRARAPSSACASTATTLEPRFKVIGCDLWSDEPGFADAAPRRGVTGICGSGIIEVVGRDVPRRHHHRGRRDRRRAGGRARRASSRHGRTFAYVLHDGEPRHPHHPDRRARHPARQGRALCRRASC